VGLLREHADDPGDYLTRDPKGRHLPEFLEQLSDRLAQDQKLVLEELGSLANNIEHIKHVIAMQQSYSKVAGVTEWVEPADVLEDALRIHNRSLEQHNIEVVRDYAPNLPRITVEKHKVLQILVNLISNAKHACAESNRPDRKLTLSAANGEGTLKFVVSDNGVGIPSENLTRIFSFGFTTRKKGHGFGLHSGALAAREMGGDLRVQSEGAGLGAAFTLELPLQRAGKASATALETRK
jgi:C4-dicarboxylate-specific signal transduction histidine kinase